MSVGRGERLPRKASDSRNFVPETRPWAGPSPRALQALPRRPRLGRFARASRPDCSPCRPRLAASLRRSRVAMVLMGGVATGNLPGLGRRARCGRGRHAGARRLRHARQCGCVQGRLTRCLMNTGTLRSRCPGRCSAPPAAAPWPPPRSPAAATSPRRIRHGILRALGASGLRPAAPLQTWRGVPRQLRPPSRVLPAVLPPLPPSQGARRPPPARASRRRPAPPRPAPRRAGPRGDFDARPGPQRTRPGRHREA